MQLLSESERVLPLASSRQGGHNFMIGPMPSCLCDLSLSSLKIGGWPCPGFSHIPPGLAFDKFTGVYSVTDETVEEVIARDATRPERVGSVSVGSKREGSVEVAAANLAHTQVPRALLSAFCGSSHLS